MPRNPSIAGVDGVQHVILVFIDVATTRRTGRRRGQKILDVVPENDALLVEVRVAPNLIDHVRDGLTVDVRFSSFAHSPQLVVAGTVVSISSDLIVEPQTNMSYYLARVRVTPEGLKTLGKRQMQSGMPVEVVVKTGERSLMTYLLHPLTKRVAAAMKEE